MARSEGTIISNHVFGTRFHTVSVGHGRSHQAEAVYSMPAIGRKIVHASAHVGRRRINPMEETAGLCRAKDAGVNFRRTFS